MICWFVCLFSALLAVCNDEQRLILVMNLTPGIGMVACHKQGSFSIQAMMDCLCSQTQIGFLSDALNNDVQRIILNCSGHYGKYNFMCPVHMSAQCLTPLVLFFKKKIQICAFFGAMIRCEVAQIESHDELIARPKSCRVKNSKGDSKNHFLLSKNFRIPALLVMKPKIKVLVTECHNSHDVDRENMNKVIKI